MGLIDRLLPVWILAAMAIGVSIGKLEPALKEDLESIRLADVSLPVGLGLIWMMYPILAKVRYGSMAGFAVASPKLEAGNFGGILLGCFFQEDSPSGFRYSNIPS